MGGIQSLSANPGIHSSLIKSEQSMFSSVQRLSSGLRINTASDDAAGLAVATHIESDIRGLRAANRNVSDATSMLQVAEASMGEVADMLQRRRELTLQVVNGTLGAQDKINVDREYSMLSEEIKRVIDSTEFSDHKLLDGSNSTISIQIGEDAGESVQIELPDLANNVAFQLGVTMLGNDSGSGGGPLGTYPDSTRIYGLYHVDNALDVLNEARAAVGAGINRMASVSRQIEVEAETGEAGRARIMDTDYAEETANFAREQIQSQAAMAMSRQANTAAQQVMSLIAA